MSDDVRTDPEASTVSKTLGLQRVVEMKDGRASVEYLAGMHMCHSGGIVQGGFVAAWIDAAMAHAVRSLGQADVVPLTLEMKVSYFSAARPGLVLAEAWLERAGRSTVFAEGHLKSESGEVVAKASSTIRLGSSARARAASEKALKG
ncbi:thioesterase [Oceanicola sp. 22II-s10i]|uniref:PaaI family thioesterase n=1 Tax=Oceanicola sp. 22II-s10i TaxID=1317116 RepID=UPI000B523C7C|nr:PaaI family thioesterase [Oceanicola sp. 22II-s10i]OWU83256.1 thioesterase [Oceanicola sp. 22II-s10i]